MTRYGTLFCRIAIAIATVAPVSEKESATIAWANSFTERGQGAGRSHPRIGRGDGFSLSHVVRVATRCYSIP